MLKENKINAYLINLTNENLIKFYEYIKDFIKDGLKNDPNYDATEEQLILECTKKQIESRNQKI